MIKLKGKGKLISNPFLFILLIMIFEAFSLEIRYGILKLFTFVAGVSTKPGQISFTFTLYFNVSIFKLSARFISAALVGP